MARNRLDLREVVRKLESTKRDMPKIIANQAKNFFVQSFRKQGWDDGSLNQWDKRNPDRDSGRAILIKSGKLRRSIRIQTETFNKILIGTNVPYAKVHNEGGDYPVKAYVRKNKRGDTIGVIGARSFKKSTRIKYGKKTSGISIVKAHTMNMPKRQFMGNSKTLLKMQERTILRAINKAFRQA